jgi:catechol-2,3-dioxygenase
MRAAGSSNDHDLGLFSIGERAAPSTAGRQSVGLYHLAWEVDTLLELASVRDRLAEEGALIGATDHGTTKALYGRDPDDLEFEVSWLVPADLITDDIVMTSQRLDLEAEIERFGPETLSGIGVSRARPVEA